MKAKTGDQICASKTKHIGNVETTSYSYGEVVKATTTGVWFSAGGAKQFALHGSYEIECTADERARDEELCHQADIERDLDDARSFSSWRQAMILAHI